MKLFAAPNLAGALAIGACVQTALAAPPPLHFPRGAANSSPKFTYDPNTSEYCVWWLDSDGTWTCPLIASIYGAAVEDLLIWVRSPLRHTGPLVGQANRRRRTPPSRKPLAALASSSPQTSPTASPPWSSPTSRFQRTLPRRRSLPRSLLLSRHFQPLWGSQPSHCQKIRPCRRPPPLSSPPS